MDLRHRICVWIIIVGLINFLAFAMMYFIIGGDAPNGQIVEVQGKRRYLIQLRGSERDQARQQASTQPTPAGWTRLEVGSDIYIYNDGFNKTLFKDIGRDMYIYSGIHSALIWITIAAVLLAMLTLAKDQLVTTLEGNIISGRALIHVVATVVVLTTVFMTIKFLHDFIRELIR